MRFSTQLKKEQGATLLMFRAFSHGHKHMYDLKVMLLPAN
jgi:hypothetical protein